MAKNKSQFRRGEEKKTSMERIQCAFDPFLFASFAPVFFFSSVHKNEKSSALRFTLISGKEKAVK